MEFITPQNVARFDTGKSSGHLAAFTRSHLIGDHPSGLTREQTTETMDPSPKTIGLRHYPPMKFRAYRSCEATQIFPIIYQNRRVYKPFYMF